MSPISGWCFLLISKETPTSTLLFEVHVARFARNDEMRLFGVRFSIVLSRLYWRDTTTTKMLVAHHEAAQNCIEYNFVTFLAGADQIQFCDNKAILVDKINSWVTGLVT